MIERPILSLSLSPSPLMAGERVSSWGTAGNESSLVSHILGGTLANLGFLFSQQQQRLPSGWGQSGGRPWFQVSSCLFHEPLRKNVRELKQLEQSGSLHYAAEAELRNLKDWVHKLSLLLEGFSQLKMTMSEERVKYGFVTYINPDYHSVFQAIDETDTLLAKLLGSEDCQDLFEEDDPENSSKKKRKKMALRSASLEPGHRLILRDELILELNGRLRSIAAKLESTMQAEESLLWPLLSSQFTEATELHCVLGAISRQDFTSASEALALCVIVEGLKLWGTVKESLQLIRCLSFVQRVLLFAPWSQRSGLVTGLTPSQRLHNRSHSLPVGSSPTSAARGWWWSNQLVGRKVRQSCPSDLESGYEHMDSSTSSFTDATDCFLSTPTSVSTIFSVATTPVALRDI